MTITFAGLVVRRVLDVHDELAGLDRDQLLAHLADIDEAVSHLKVLRADVEKAVAGQMPMRQLVVVDQVGVFEHNRTAQITKWDDDRTAKAVMSAAWDAGEIDHPDDVAALIMRVAHIDYWRVGELERLGLTANEYRTKTGGRDTVTRKA